MAIKLPSLRNVFKKPTIAKPTGVAGSKVTTNGMLNATGNTKTYATRQQARKAWKASQPKQPGLLNRVRTNIGNKLNINRIKPAKPGTVRQPTRIGTAINNFRNKVGTATNNNNLKAPKPQIQKPVTQPKPQIQKAPEPVVTGRRRKRGFSTQVQPTPQPKFLNSTQRTTRKRSSTA